MKLKNVGTARALASIHRSPPKTLDGFIAKRGDTLIICEALSQGGSRSKYTLKRRIGGAEQEEIEVSTVILAEEIMNGWRAGYDSQGYDILPLTPQ